MLKDAGMSWRYLIAAAVGGRIRFLRMGSSGCQRSLEGLCRQMAEKLCISQKVGDLGLEPWLVDQITRQPRPGSDKPFLTEQATDS